MGGGGACSDPGPASLAHLRHELRTPLNHVLGYSEMLLEDAGEAGELARALQRGPRRGPRAPGRRRGVARSGARRGGRRRRRPPRRRDRSRPPPPGSGGGPAPGTGGRERRPRGLGGLGTHRRGGGAAGRAGRGLGSPSRFFWRGRSGRGGSPGGDGPVRERSPHPESGGRAGHDPRGRRRRGEPRAPDPAPRPGRPPHPGRERRPGGARSPAGRAGRPGAPRRHDARPRRARPCWSASSRIRTGGTSRS